MQKQYSTTAKNQHYPGKELYKVFSGGMGYENIQ